MRHSLLTFFLAAALAGPAAAQTSAKITGIVHSSAGKAVSGAKIVAAGENRSGQVEANTAEDGTFTLPQLAADTYQISASAEGFNETAVVVELGVGQTRAVELTLNTLAESTVIAVSKDAATADVTSARLSVNVTPVEIAGMPLNGRSYSILTLVEPLAPDVREEAGRFRRAPQRRAQCALSCAAGTRVAASEQRRDRRHSGRLERRRFLHGADGAASRRARVAVGPRLCE